jgi:hypothetical protein
MRPSTFALLALTACLPASAVSQSPLDYGADPTGARDSSPAFDRLAKACAASRQIEVVIPPGRYRLSHRVVWRASGNASNYGLRIRGSGEDVTELLIDNPEGGLQFIGTEISRMTVTFSDFSLVALRPDAGTALEFDTANPGDQHSRQFNAENLLIRGERFDTGSFRAGVIVRNAWYPRLRNVKITDSYGPDRPAEGEWMQDAILLEDCYSPLITECYVWGGKTGLTYRAKWKGPEDGIVSQSYFVGNERGIVVSMTKDTTVWEKPAFHISDCHINYRDCGVYLSGVRQATIHHCLFYCHDTAGAVFFGGGKGRDFDPIDIDAAYASDTIIDDNLFTEPANPRRVAVRISPQSGYVMIRDNQFNHDGTAIRNESKLPSYASGNVFGGRRDFSQALRHYDDRTGTLVLDAPAQPTKAN